MKDRIAIIGLGYVGLPLFMNFGLRFNTIGYDNSPKRVETLKNYEDYNNEFSTQSLKNSLKHSKITKYFKDVINCNYYILTIPTPIYKNKKPNLSNLNQTIKNLSRILKINDTVIIESTVYPGYCEEVAIPLIERISGLRCNKDFGFAFSPERVNPGDKKNSITKITKIVSSNSSGTLIRTAKLYKSALNTKIHKVKDIKIAESAKIIENTQRDINIALINEFSIFLDKMNINYDEVMKAASTKWNFLNFKRGLVGGHCIGVDPYYLIYKSKKIGLESKMIYESRKVNSNMPLNIATQIQNKITKYKFKNLLILGFSFKENCSDIRNTLVYDLNNQLSLRGFNIKIVDPIVNSNEAKKTYNLNIYKKINYKKFEYLVISKYHNIFKKDKYYKSLINFFKLKKMLFVI